MNAVNVRDYQPGDEPPDDSGDLALRRRTIRMRERWAMRALLLRVALVAVLSLLVIAAWNGACSRIRERRALEAQEVQKPKIEPRKWR